MKSSEARFPAGPAVTIPSYAVPDGEYRHD